MADLAVDSLQEGAQTLPRVSLITDIIATVTLATEVTTMTTGEGGEAAMAAVVGRGDTVTETAQGGAVDEVQPPRQLMVSEIYEIYTANKDPDTYTLWCHHTMIDERNFNLIVFIVKNSM